MNCLFERVEVFLDLFKDKDIILYGSGSVAAKIVAVLRAYKREIKYIVDGNEEKQGREKYEILIKSPYALLDENKNNVVVLLALTSYDAAEKVLNEMGYEKDVNYTSFGNIVRGRIADVFDPFLGYTRIDDIEGFTFFGNMGAKKRILTIGSSTTDSSTGGINSWPYYLQKKCEEDGIDCLIINGGMTGYYSGQELLKLLRDGIYFEPCLVISFSGYNDAGNLGCNLRYPLISSYLYNSVEKMQQDKKNGYGFEKQINSAENWFKNIRMINGICREFGISFFSFLEPCIHTGNYLLEEKERIAFFNIQKLLKRNIDEIIEFYINVREMTSNIPYIYDLTNIFSGKSGIFYDTCHCNEEGNQIIANEIYKKIISKI